MKSQRIRILVVMGTLEGGGSERQAVRLLQNLNRKHFQPELYLIRRIGSFVKEIPSDVPVHCFRDDHPSFLNWPGRFRSLRVQHLSNIIRKRNIDLVYDRTFHVTLTTGAATRLTSTKRVSVIVADPKEDLEKSGGRLRWLKRRLLQQYYREATIVLAVSEGIKASAISYYALQAKGILVVRNPLDTTSIDSQSSSFVPDWNPANFHIVTAGRLAEQKGYEYLLQAMNELVHIRRQTHVRLHILGIGPLEASFKQYVQEYSLEEHIEFAGFQENPYPFFKAANLFCLSSLYEGLPNVLLEAMACEVPVLSTDCPSGPREILKDGQLGRLIPMANPTALADAIDDAIQHEKRWRSFIPMARHHVEEEYNLKTRIGQLEDLFETIVRS